MHNDYEAKASYAAGTAVGLAMNSQVEPTIGENIDAKIARAEAQVVRLKAVKAQMESSGLLSIKIGDLRQAMDY